MKTHRSLSSPRVRSCDPGRRAGRLRAVRAAMLTLGLALAATLHSETNDSSASTGELKKRSLEELMQMEIPTVYGASKHEQKTTEAPSSVSVVTRDDIQKFGYRTLAELLNGVRGFYVTYDDSYHAIGVRGVNLPGDYGGRMLIMVDGHRQNDPVFDTAASGMDFLLDMDLIERVEVIRGPGSSLYGNNAFFGVINVITRKGRDVNGAEIASSAGSFDAYSGRMSYGNKFTNGFELLLSGTLYDSAGQRRLYYPEFSTSHNGVAENMDGEWSRSAFASISWKAFSLDAGFVDRKKTWPTAPYSTEDATVIFNDPHFWTIDERAFANLKFQHTFENDWEALARVYYDHYRYDGQYPYDYRDPLYPVTLNRDFVQSESVGVEAQVSRTFFEKHRVTAGAEVRYDYQLAQENFESDPAVAYLNSHETASVCSFYVQDEFHVRTNLILNACVRYDHFSTFGDTVNPRMALIYQPWEATTFKLLYGQAYRAPNAYENYYSSTSNKRNPDLGPETIRSYEVVYDQRLGQNWQGNVSLFLNDINNLIRYRKDPVDSLFYFDNLDSVQAKGVEVEVKAHWPNGLRGSASYSYTQTEDAATGKRLVNSPEHLGKLALSVPLWKDKVFASAELQGMSQRDDLRGGKVNGFWLANATLFNRELVKGLELSAGVYNLFDQRYRDPAADDFTQNSIPQHGRSFRVKLTYRF
jgi:outer membrane receptor for ferrienterochelin and colicins